MDSPGGTVAGAFDFRDWLMSQRGKKPIYAFAKDTMASAAYLIGSACDKVYTTQTGSVGSIGVVAMHLDQSAANKAKGVKPTMIYAGDYKVAGNPHEPLKGEALDYLQESVNDSYEMFVNAVAESRGLKSDKIKDTEARMYRGEKAVEVGLSDGVRTFESTLEELAQSAKRVQKSMSVNLKGNEMDKETMEQLKADVEQAQADVTKYRKEAEELKASILKEGYRITAEGLEKKAAAEMVEVNGKKFEKDSIPAEVLEALETANKEKADAALAQQAKEVLPNFDEKVAKSLLSLDLDEDTLKALKAADAAIEASMEEKGESDVDGSMSDPSSKLNALAKDLQLKENITFTEAYARVSQTQEGQQLLKAIYKKD